MRCTQCDREMVARGLCNTHYKKMMRTGTLERIRREAVPGGRSKREAHLLHRYGLSEAEYQAMEAGQGGCCAICGESQAKRAMFVDHDHVNGTVRGLLCRKCNSMLGAVEHREDPDRVLFGALAILASLTGGGRLE